jgi:cellulose synthase operon protein YhjQ
VKIISVVSAKGGVGKTTVASNLSAALRYAGQRVLAIDLDPQNALRLHFGTDPDQIDGVSRATLSGRSWRSTGFDSASGIHVLPYGAVNEPDREAFEAHLDRHPDWLAANLGALGLDEHDVIVIDTPPGPSVYMRASLSAAHLALIVILPDAASYATLPRMEGLVETYADPKDHFTGHAIVINQTDHARLLARDVTQVLYANFGDRIIGHVHQDQSVSEALAFNQSVLDYDSRSQAAQDYIACAQEVAARLQLVGHHP